MTEAIEINRELFVGIFAGVAHFLAESGCPLTDEQTTALNGAVGAMGSQR